MEAGEPEMPPQVPVLAAMPETGVRPQRRYAAARCGGQRQGGDGLAVLRTASRCRSILAGTVCFRRGCRD